MLNEYISSPTLCTGDSAILAVTQLILTSWYWSSTEELHAHMSGFRKMIQLRGGCRDLGMEGCTSKIALLNDAVIALCHNTDPVIFGQPGFEYDDPFHAPLQVNFNSPLLFNCPPFLIPSSSLRLHKRTAEILDGTRVLMQAVYDLPEDAGIAKVHEVSSLAASLLSFLNQLPDQVLLESNGDRDNAPVFTGQKRKRVGGEDTIVSSKKSHGASLVTTRSSTEDPPDMVYVTVRLTAVVWARAILERLPTKDVCTEAEFIRIWSMAWAAGLDKWSSLSGIYAWMTIAIGPLCHTTIHARMVKTLTVTTFTYMGTENWHVASEIATVALKIQAWLRAGKESKPQGALSGAFGGEKGIETFGFAFKENTMDLPDHRYESQPHEEEDDDDDDEQSAWAS
ncbi:hypothetical protein UVI_02050320 [Ustilaginoidea virens]|nr:hypothetical protein UVI_02050320 [Ustilaginoidea virens]